MHTAYSHKSILLISAEHSDGIATLWKDPAARSEWLLCTMLTLRRSPTTTRAYLRLENCLEKPRFLGLKTLKTSNVQIGPIRVY